MQVSDIVTQLKDEAEKKGAYYVLQRNYPGKTISIPYYSRMSSLSIDEMNLSVRSSNALKRSGAITIGKVADFIAENRLRTIRNLGIKSEKEIIRCFFTLCYGHLTITEKVLFWQNIADEFNDN